MCAIHYTTDSYTSQHIFPLFFLFIEKLRINIIIVLWMVIFLMSESTSSELKAGSRILIAGNSPKLIVISILFVAIITVFTELRIRLPEIRGAYSQYMESISAGAAHSLGMFSSFLSSYGVVLAILLLLLGGVFQVGFMSYCLKVTRGSRGDFKDIFNGFLLFGKVLLIHFIYAVFVIAWTILLIFPGIVAFYRYRQAYYILLDDPNKGALQSIRESKLLMRGHKADLFILDFSFIGWYALSGLLTVLMLFFLSFSIPFVLIWLSPYIGLSHAAFYDRLLDRFAV